MSRIVWCLIQGAVKERKQLYGLLLRRGVYIAGIMRAVIIAQGNPIFEREYWN